MCEVGGDRERRIEREEQQGSDGVEEDKGKRRDSNNVRDNLNSPYDTHKNVIML